MFFMSYELVFEKIFGLIFNGDKLILSIMYFMDGSCIYYWFNNRLRIVEGYFNLLVLIV